MKTGKELREYTRIAIKVEVEVEADNQEKVSGETECVSMKGLFIECGSTFPVGTKVVIKVFVGGRGSNVEVWARGRVTFVNDDGMAMQFTSHLGMDSYVHLHKLVLFNADAEAEKVEKEIETHLGEVQSEL